MCAFTPGRAGRNGNYSHRELDEWADRLERWCAEVDVFAYFNNDWEGYAIENARYLKRHTMGSLRSDDACA